MTFREINDLLSGPSSGGGRVVLEDSALQQLLSPARRGFVQACRGAIAGAAPWGQIPNLRKLFGPREKAVFAHQVAAAHIAVAAAKRRWPFPHRASESDLALIARNLNLPVGWLLDLERELDPNDASGSPSVLGLQGGLLCGTLRPATHVVTVPCLLVESRQRGVPANLTLELVPGPQPGGRSEFYPIPALAFVDLDTPFRDSLDRAAGRIKAAGLWPAGYDIR